jgi:hypothetical protein
MRRLTLGDGQFAVLFAGIVTVLVVCWVTFMPTWEYLYLREIAIPKLEEEYGFVGGTVAFRHANGTFEEWGILRLTPGSRLAELGVRPGDVPTAYHGGMAAMHYALRAAEQKQFAAFDVINPDDWNVGRKVMRAVVAYPRATDLPVHFRSADADAFMSPSGRFSLATRQAIGSPDRYELWVRNGATGESRKIYSYEMHVAAVWSTDEQWIALTDDDDVPQCMLLETTGGGVLNIREKARLPATAGESGSDQQLSCEIFGWVRGTPRIAIRLWASGDGAMRCYFLDTSTWTFTDASAAAKQ